MKRLIALTISLGMLLAGQVLAMSLSPGEIVVDGQTVSSTAEIDTVAVDGSKIFFGAGVYLQGFVISKNNVVISGENTHFVNAAVQGKAAIVVQGNNVVIENIECSKVAVRDNNGACVRQEGRDLTLNNVYFHDAQQGVLQNANTGFLHIKFSRFENLGKAGRAHAVYANGDALHIQYSSFLASKDQAHSIKSRAANTVIEHSTISSADGDDSRLLDISNGGKLIVKHCVLHQGRNSVNGQLIGYALEGLRNNRVNQIQFTDNVVLAERSAGNVFLLMPKTLSWENVQVSNALFIGKYADTLNIPKSTNYFVQDKSILGLQNDTLPALRLLESMKLGLF